MTMQASAGVSTSNTPPQNLEAEVAVLGALMVSVEAMERVSDILRPTYFYSPQHADIYRAAYELHKRGDPVDILTLNAELEKLGLLERIGGTDYLANLESGGGIAANVESYARLVEETAVRRGLLSAGRMIEGLGRDAGLDIDEALDAAGSEIMRLADERTTHEAVRLSDALGETWNRLERLHENPDQAPGVRSGFVDLDAKTAGFQPGTLTIIAARPSVGKTSLALNIAQHAALREKVPVAVFSLEMSRWELTQRLLSGEAGVDSYLLRTGKIADSDWPKIANAMGSLSEGEIYIDDRPGATVLDMRAKARRLKMQKKIGLIVIDYVQLMSGSGRPENRTQEVSEISRSLKRLSVELDIPVIALSQLSRAPEQRGDRRPQLSDLRESGCLTGDSLVFLPDTGDYERMDRLVGQTGFSVMALNTASWKLEPRPVTNAFSTGRKPVFDLKTRLGCSVQATGNHKFLTVDGWRRLDSLRPLDRLARPKSGLGVAFPGTRFDGQNRSRESAARVASVIGAAELMILSESDVYWDQISTVEPAGFEQVYDLTVDGLHNFVVNDVIAHNSLEQDSDVVIFLYREGLHNPEVKRNKAELIISKHRNGPIGEVPLIFLESQTRFVSATRQAPPMQAPAARPEPAPPSFLNDDEDLD